MRKTFMYEYKDILKQRGQVGIPFWLAVTSDDAASILREHISALRRELDHMGKLSRLRIWAIGIGIGFFFSIAVLLSPGILKVFLALSALAVLGTSAGALVVIGFARVTHRSTPW